MQNIYIYIYIYICDYYICILIYIYTPQTLRNGIFGANPDFIARTKTPFPIITHPSASCGRRALLGSRTTHCPASKQRNGVLGKRHLRHKHKVIQLYDVQRPLKQHNSYHGKHMNINGSFNDSTLKWNCWLHLNHILFLFHLFPWKKNLLFLKSFSKFDSLGCIQQG